MEMAAEAAVSFAVETLGKLLIEKAQFLIGVKGDVEWLEKELRSIQCFLKDAAKKQSDSESIRNWISDIREVAHDAEDAIEIFVLKVQSKSLKKKYGCFPNHLYHLNNVGEQIKSIRQTLTDIQDRRVRYDIQREEPITRTKTQEEIETRRRLAYWQNDKQVVGLEEDMKQLLGKAVFEKSEGLSVAAILGMGGMGKSTLAREVYNHPDIARLFECRAWAVVSSEFAVEEIMKQLLLQLGISLDDLKLLESVGDILGRRENMKKEVHKRLTGKRYFIVLDDVWEAAHWETLSTAFPDGDQHSRLLLTSRNPVITMNSGYVHTMKALDAIESWDLFMRKAFSGKTSVHECPGELKKVGEEIVKKCGGLPLAISVVGGLLAKKTRSKSEWDKVYKEMNSHLGRNGGDLNNITSILELSYQNLPQELKACFMCLGFFKEDAIVKAKELVHIWIAQGLVSQKVVGEDDSMEEVARDYLNELVGRNMVQAKEMKYEKVKAWQMHDLLRDLSIRKAKEEMDFEEVRQGENSHQHSLAIPRHRAVYFQEPNFIFSTNRNQRIRSLHAHCYENWLFVSDGPLSYWKSFELLRVLNLGKTKFRVLPKGIGELTGLRYLKMSYGGGVSRLPRSWAKLKNLEVLVIRDSFWGIKIDKVILKMESLRHLNILVESSEVDLGSMRNLQTVHMFRMRSSSDVQKIQGMSCVSELGIYIGETSGNLFGCLSSLENLSHLKLLGVSSWTDVNGITSLHRVTQLKLCNRFFRDTTLPVYFPPNLLHLTLSSMQLEEDPMPVLEKLPHLLSLKLEDVTNRDTTMVITSGGFPTLKVLRFQDMEDSYKMEIEESAMPVLNQFIISKCPDVDVENAPERIKSTMLHPH